LIAKDGLALVIGSLVIFLIFLIIRLYVQQPVLTVITVLLGVFSVFNLYFFRDPHREPPQNPNAILSPADGKIIKITEVYEPRFFDEKVRMVSIFLSVFDVHVNRVPISGKVRYFHYQPGKFLAAFKDKASEENEHTAIGIVDPRGRRVLFKQIAGIVARRIVCNLREGHTVQAGDRMGMIRYGSRVDIFFDLNARVMVSPGQRVRAGETVIAQFTDEGDQEKVEANVVDTPVEEVY